ncbi:MAG TPA: succinate dehydrogenase assembly factor 2, partial [Burkholderiaceae bacterium]|nr:succinate dehydrogenase assembly factor 2 [Burkholderiaceae bacterium]
MPEESESDLGDRQDQGAAGAAGGVSVDATLPLARRRLRLRARRGLLENDVIITRFLDRHGDDLTLNQIASFEALLDLP